MIKSIAIASDHAGLELKKLLLAELSSRGITVVDFGTNSHESCDYPDFAHSVCEVLERGQCDCGILVCGTGVGMSIAANRHPTMRAVVCSEPLSAKMARQHNNANVLCLGARVVGPGTALEIMDAFLASAFEGGRHAVRVSKINLAGLLGHSEA